MIVLGDNDIMNKIIDRWDIISCDKAIATLEREREGEGGREGGREGDLCDVVWLQATSCLAACYGITLKLKVMLVHSVMPMGPSHRIYSSEALFCFLLALKSAKLENTSAESTCAFRFSLKLCSKYSRAGYAASHTPHQHTSHWNALCCCPIVTTAALYWNFSI